MMGKLSNAPMWLSLCQRGARTTSGLRHVFLSMFSSKQREIYLRGLPFHQDSMMTVGDMSPTVGNMKWRHAENATPHCSIILAQDDQTKKHPANGRKIWRIGTILQCCRDYGQEGECLCFLSRIWWKFCAESARVLLKISHARNFFGRSTKLAMQPITSRPKTFS